MDDLTTEVALICKLRGSLICLAHLFGRVATRCLNNRALTDVRLTGAGIKCLYCIRTIMRIEEKGKSGEHFTNNNP